MLAHQRISVRGIQCRQITEHNPFERTLCHIGMHHLIALQLQARIGGCQSSAERGGKTSMNSIPYLMDGIDIGHLEQLGQGSFPRQGKDLGLECRIQRGVVQDGDKGCQQGLGDVDSLPVLHLHNPCHHRLVDQHLGRIPTGKFVTGVAHQEGQSLVAVVIMQLDRRTEVPQQRGNRLDWHLIEDKGLLCFEHVEHLAYFLALILQRDDGAILVIQLDVEGDVQRQFLRLILSRRRVLAHMQAIDAAGSIVLIGHCQLRGAGLAIPAAEPTEISASGIFHRLHEIITGHRLTVKALEIEAHTRLEIVFSQQGMQHADHFRPFLVDGQGVEVVHLDHHIRADGVGHGAGIFGKLRTAHGTHIVDAVDTTGSQIGRELLIPEHRQPLFEAKLEPVATSDPVAGPVMEVFVTYDPLDTMVIAVGGGGRVGQHELGVENVQPLVLHGAHVEEVHRDDHIDVEVVLEAKALLVPAHGVDQALHGETGSVQVALVNEDLEGYLAAALGCVVAALYIKVTGHQGKQVTGFWEGILPLHEVATAIQLTAVDLVAVGKQEGILGLVGSDPCAVPGQYVGAVQIIGDTAKTFGLTLGAVGIT